MRYFKKLIISLLFFPLLVHANTYKWTDASGAVHYSDVPQADAATVQLPTDQSYRVTPSASISLPASPTTSVVTYSKVQITRPADNEFYANNEYGKLTVTVKVKPALRDKDKLQVILDSQPIGKATANTTIDLNAIDRGEHTLQVQIINSDNKVVASSNRVVFNMQRPLRHKTTS